MYEENVKMIDYLITLQKKSLRAYIIYTIGIIGLGLLIILLGYLFNTDSAIKNFITSGGTLVTSFSGFSLKEFISKKEAISLYSTFKVSMDIYKENTEKQQQFSNIIQGYVFKN